MTFAFLQQLGVPELLVIGVLFFIFFGAKRLPEFAGSIGKSVTSFRTGMEEAKEEAERAKAERAKADNASTAQLEASTAQKAEEQTELQPQSNQSEATDTTSN